MVEDRDAQVDTTRREEVAKDIDKHPKTHTNPGGRGDEPQPSRPDLDAKPK